MSSAARRYFLDVRQSASGLAWEHRLTPLQENAATAMAQGQGVSDLVARIIAARGIPVEEAHRFLQPTIRDLLPDPLSLTDMDRAAERIAAAIRRQERVAIFGDYDVDGAASSALLKRYLDWFGLTSEIYIPDRIFEGYGPNPAAMRELAGRGAGLIVTVDCGTNSTDAIEAARQAGADVVVLDHHQVGGPLPLSVPIVNPNRDDDLSGQGHLCAAGVVFLALVQVSRLLREGKEAISGPDLLSLLDLVALATICDVVPLKGVNRAFVSRGVLVARSQTNPGIAALAKVARIGEPINPFHFGFAIGPRINAGGRIGNAALGSRLLASADPLEAGAIAAELDRLNGERQQMESAMLEEARAQAEAELACGNAPAILIAESTTWHPGIVGLIASRLKDQTRRPAFAIAFNESDIGTGSGRSISGVDLGRIVRGALERGLLIKGGGHAMAAGITLPRAGLGAFRAYLEEAAATAVEQALSGDALKIDGAVSADGANLRLLDEMERAGPYGAGHPQPVLALPHHRVADVRPVGHGHLRLQLVSQAGSRLQAIAFRAQGSPLGDLLANSRGETMHLAGTLAANSWNGQTKPQMRIIDAARPART